MALIISLLPLRKKVDIAERGRPDEGLFESNQI